MADELIRLIPHILTGGGTFLTGLALYQSARARLLLAEKARDHRRDLSRDD
jgi:hypothetical protein